MAQVAATRMGATTRKPFLNPRRREAVIGYLFASPWIFGFLVLTLGPMIFSLYASFTQYNIVNPPRWIGLQNYQFIFHDDYRFRISLANTIFYVLVKTPIAISFALFFAVLLNMGLPGTRIFRTIFYMPTVLTGVAAIFLWIWVLNPYGLLNNGLRTIGIQNPPNWFFDAAWSKPALIIMSLWYIGSPMLILLAGLNGVPKSLHEAADIDGAGTWTKFWRITIPLLSPTLFFIILTNIIGAFQVFNSAFVVSNTVSHNAGDPDQSLLFYEVYLYIRAFGPNLDMGFACALAWILFVLVMIVTGIQLWLSKRWVYYES